jgi:hypothetical protein
MAEDQAPEPIASKPLSAVAERALKEAEERRASAKASEPRKEIGGRKGPEPVRYGDWELNGIAQDF